jgi:hypothetical protein
VDDATVFRPDEHIDEHVISFVSSLEGERRRIGRLLLSQAKANKKTTQPSHPRPNGCGSSLLARDDDEDDDIDSSKENLNRVKASVLVRCIYSLKPALHTKTPKVKGTPSSAQTK